MLTIRLFCAAGMSTSLVVNKMKEAAEKRGMDADIAAYPESNMKQCLEEGIDVALLGPQVRYILKKAQAACGEKGVPVDIIPAVQYGRVDGEGILDFALELIEKNKK